MLLANVLELNPNFEPTEQRPYNKIMAAVGPKPVEDETDSLAVKIIEMATSLACGEQGELNVFRKKAIVGQVGRDRLSFPLYRLFDISHYTGIIHTLYLI